MARLSFFKRFPGLSTLLILQFVLLLVVSYQIQVDNRMSLLEKAFLTIFAPLQEVNDDVVESITDSFADQKSRAELEAENERFKTALRHYQHITTTLTESELEVQRLRQLLDMPRDLGWTQIHAEVTGANFRRNDWMITINKGSRQGVRRDMGVICPDGVVGLVWEVGPNHAKVMTANNPSSVIAAMIQDGRDSESYVIGQGNNFVGRLENFPNFKPLRPQDLVLTSGLDGLFPKGHHIGRVISATQSSYMFQEVELQFTTDFARLETVTVVIPMCEEDDLALE